MDCGLASRFAYKQQKTHQVENVLDLISMHEELCFVGVACLEGLDGRLIRNTAHRPKQAKGRSLKGDGKTAGWLSRPLGRAP